MENKEQIMVEVAEFQMWAFKDMFNFDFILSKTFLKVFSLSIAIDVVIVFIFWLIFG